MKQVSFMRRVLAAAGGVLLAATVAYAEDAAPAGGKKFQPVWLSATASLRGAYVTYTKQSFADMDAFIKDGQYTVDQNSLDGKKVLEKTPATGNKFAIFNVFLKDKGSIGKADYTLKIGATTYPCLAVTVSGSPFDPRLRDVRQSGAVATTEALLIFEVPEIATEGTLVPALKTTIPKQEAPLVFMMDDSKAP